MERRHVVLIAVLMGGISSEGEARKRDAHRADEGSRVFASSDHVFKAVGVAYGVPEGLLRGIWKKESSELAGGWREDSADWYRARSLIRPDGECLKQYPEKQERCREHWRSLVALCAQRYKRGPQKGRRVCNPYQVYTSYAFAMGPMQHMPAEHVERVTDARGRSVWQYTKRSIDFNRDGVFDLHNLADAVAATAFELKTYRESKNSDGSWRWAANRYFGSQKKGYYEGRWEWNEETQKLRYRRGVLDHWVAWCKEHDCRARTARR